jgi:hypothetical protein
MTCVLEQPTPERVQEVARQTFQALRRRESFLAFWLTDRNDLHRDIAQCVKMVCAVNPAHFSEDDFADLTASLSRVIDALERYFAKHGSGKDVAQCYFLGHSLNSLKDAKRWIAQGLPPDPSKRPSAAEREQLSNAIALEAFKAISA